MTTPVIMDAVAVGVAVLLALLGAWRGVFKTLLGVAVFVAALVGAGLIANSLSGPVTEWVVPHVMEQVDARIQQEADRQAQNALNSASDSLKDAASASGVSEAAPDLSTVPGFDAGTDTIPVGQIATLLEKIGLSRESREALTERVRERLESAGQSVVDSARVALEDVLRECLQPMIHSALYGVSFLLLSLVLKIAAKFLAGALDKVPGLSTVNHVLGLLLGLTEGALLLVIASWILRTVGYTVEAPPLSDTVVLRFLAEHSLMDLLPSMQPSSWV